MTKVMDGTYSDFKLVKTRSVAQVVIEIPIEKAQHWIQMFGVPSPDMEQWVAIAALDSRKVIKSEEGTQAVKLAGMLCNSAEFGVFLRDKMGLNEIEPDSSESIANGLRAILGIKSRTEFHENEGAMTAFYRLKGEYESWQLTR